MPEPFDAWLHVSLVFSQDCGFLDLHRQHPKMVMQPGGSSCEPEPVWSAVLPLPLRLRR